MKQLPKLLNYSQAFKRSCLFNPYLHRETGIRSLKKCQSDLRTFLIDNDWRQSDQIEKLL